MDRFNALGRGAQVMLVAGVLLFIDLFLRWQEVEFDLGPLGEGSAGVSAWDNFLGVVLGLLTIALLVWLVLRLLAVDIPLPVSAAMIGAVLAVLIAFVAILKNLVDDYSTIWSYIGVLLAIAVLVGAYLEVQAAGGIDTLKSEIPRSTARSTPTATASPAAPTPEAAPQPYEPPAAEAPEAAPEPMEEPPPPSGAPPETTPPDEPEAPYDPDTRREA